MGGTIVDNYEAYYNNIRQWSNSVTPPPTNGRTNPSRARARPTRGSTLVTSQTPASPSPYAQPAALPAAPPYPMALAPSPYPQQSTSIPARPQALHSTYASRLRTGTTLLMQPILASSSAIAVTTRSSRRGGAVNYAEPASGDEFPDAGAIDSEDSDFVASGGTRSAVRSARLSSKAPIGASVFHAGNATPVAQPAQAQQRNELDQSYLGMIPPSRFIAARPVAPTKHEYL